MKPECSNCKEFWEDLKYCPKSKRFMPTEVCLEYVGLYTSLNEEVYKCQLCDGTGWDEKTTKEGAILHAIECVGDKDNELSEEWVDENYHYFYEAVYSSGDDYYKCSKCKGTGEVDWVTNCICNNIAS